MSKNQAAELSVDEIKKLSIFEKLAMARDESKFTKDAEIKNRQGEKKYDIWTEPSVIGTVLPLYQKFRLLHYRESVDVNYVDRTTIKITVNMVLVNLDNLEERIPFSGVGTGTDSDDKDSGKASTYAVKDAMLKLFMANTGLDPDLSYSRTTAERDAEESGARAPVNTARGKAQAAEATPKEQVFAQAKEALDALWNAGFYEATARNNLGTEAADDAVKQEKTRIYQADYKRLKDSTVKDLQKDIATMRETLARHQQ